MAIPRDSPLGPGLYPKNISTPSTPIKTVIKAAAVTPSPPPAPPPPAPKAPPVADILPKVYQFPKDTLFYNVSGVRKYDQVVFEKSAATFANNEPEITMISEYIVDEQSLGVLIVFEKYYDATHYELFKQNIFAGTKFERILFLDAKSLKDETDRYSRYLSDYIGMKIDFNKHFIVFDPLVKEDRIYEYKIKASRVPSKVTEVDFDFIVESKGLGAKREVDKTIKSSLFDFAGSTLGSRDLGWLISLLNEKVPFFGRVAQDNLYGLIQPESNILFVNNTQNVLNIIKDSFSLFGEKITLSHIVNVLGGLGSDFIASFNSAINETSKTFSYANFISSIRNKVPIYSLILTVSESSNNADALNKLSKLSITLPTTKIGNESYLSIEGLTKIFNFVNGIYLTVIYSQDNNNSVEIKKIIDALNAPAEPAAPAPINSLSPSATLPVVAAPTPVVNAPARTTSTVAPPIVIVTPPANLGGLTKLR